MKIIDLAKKQLNSEILPKHIRYNDEDLYFDGIAYFDKEGNKDLLDILAINCSALTHLYDEVEIIEEDKDIKKLNAKYTSQIGKLELANKIDELIDEVNKLKNN